MQEQQHTLLTMQEQAVRRLSVIGLAPPLAQFMVVVVVVVLADNQLGACLAVPVAHQRMAVAVAPVAMSTATSMVAPVE